jgi:hypothetical protein
VNQTSRDAGNKNKSSHRSIEKAELAAP